MPYIVGFLPILLFVTSFVGSGIFFTLTGVNNAFYQLSAIVAIIPGIACGWFLHSGNNEKRMNAFLDGVRHRDIITMCIIFLLAGAFSAVTGAIGSVDSVVNLALSLIPSKFLLIGLFLTSAFISTAIGTSMGTIATIAPIAAGICGETGFLPELAVATVVGGAMFGDNLSIVSDTTIAAVLSQEASMKAKLKLNAKVALIASGITIFILLFSTGEESAIEPKGYSLLLVAPYVLLILLAAFGINVFVVLTCSIFFAWLIGFISSGYGVLDLSHDMTKGFASMQEIMILSLMVGGLSGLSGERAKKFTVHLSDWIDRRRGGSKLAQFVIVKIVCLFDILLANNTIAIIFSGEVARDIAKKYHVPPHYAATWLDTFSCVFQGIIPYGAQVLLASAAIGVSPLSITPYVYYCYVLGIVSVIYIMLYSDCNKRIVLCSNIQNSTPY